MRELVKQELKKNILQLAKTRSTGTPLQLADIIHICKRSVNRLVNEIREEGTTLSYSRKLKTYTLD